MINFITPENTMLCTSVEFDTFCKIIRDVTDGLAYAYIDGTDNVIRYDHTQKAEETGTYINTGIHAVLSKAYGIEVQYTYYHDNQVWIYYKNNTQPAIKTEDTAEFVSQIIETFESFLDDRNIVLENEEKDDALEDVDDPSEIANIYGSDYGELQTGIEYILGRWNLTE
ncbi:hypothetical protein J6A31_06640 [bacterium]|nr:hypothetical protein [bacterium]